MTDSTSSDLITHHGSCHCQDVEFEFDGPCDIDAHNCNCSICHMKKNTHVIIPSSHFRLLKGKEQLTEYTFNTHQAKHLFCKRCGVQAFYIPRSNPDGYAVTVACIEPSTINSINIVNFDGQNWEDAFKASDVGKYSKV